jgi:hypothetical protein
MNLRYPTPRFARVHQVTPTYRQSFLCLRCDGRVSDARGTELLYARRALICWLCEKSNGVGHPFKGYACDSSDWFVDAAGIPTRLHGDLKGLVQGELFGEAP